MPGPAKGRGVGFGLFDARHLVRPEILLRAPIVARYTEIPMPPAELATYAGRYTAENVGELDIIRDNDHLTLRVAVDWGLPRAASSRISR